MYVTWGIGGLRTCGLIFSDLDGDEENMVAALARTTRGPLDRDALSQRLEGSGRGPPQWLVKLPLPISNNLRHFVLSSFCQSCMFCHFCAFPIPKK